MSESDFVAMTQNGALCNQKGEIAVEDFERIMRFQLRRFVQARLVLSRALVKG